MSRPVSPAKSPAKSASAPKARKPAAKPTPEQALVKNKWAPMII